MSANLMQAREPAVDDVLEQLGRAGRDVARTAARATYTGAYFMAYAAVFSAVLVNRALPKQNPVYKGFRDGGRAARDILAETATQAPRP